MVTTHTRDRPSPRLHPQKRKHSARTWRCKTLLFVSIISLWLFQPVACTPSLREEEADSVQEMDLEQHSHRPMDPHTAEYCAEHPLWRRGGDTLLDYDYLLHCTILRHSTVAKQAVLLVLFAMLLYLLSSTADSFFCPSLQTIVERYRIPPDIAGVTFLSFGNGSPDVFSNIAAFSAATPKIGVTSLLGGGLIVTTVITASVGLATQDQQQLVPRKYVRDVVFYMIGVAYLCFVFFDGEVHVMKAIGFLLLYAAYVTTVLLDRYLAKLLGSKDRLDEIEELLRDDVHRVAYYSPRSSNGQSSSELEDLAGGNAFFRPSAEEVVPLSEVENPFPEASDSEILNGAVNKPAPMERKRSAPTPRSGKKNQLYPDQGTDEERLALVGRPASVCIPSVPRRRKHLSTWDSIEKSAHFGYTSKKWTQSFHHIYGIEEFPSVSEVDEDHSSEPSEPEPEEKRPGSQDPVHKHIFYHLGQAYQAFQHYVWGPFEFVATLFRRVMIPLVDEETWSKGFAMVCPFFSILMVGVTMLNVETLSPWFAVALVLGGGLGAAYVEYTSTKEDPPQGVLLTPYLLLAFVMSVIWIMTIADELLAVLEMLGKLLGVSTSVLGVSVLAWGNSIGDLVSDTSIARDGFPTMAFAACFAGPMFNLLFGIGCALLFATIQRGSVSMGEPSPLVYVTFAFLFLTLVVNLVAAIMSGFRYTPRLCYFLYGLYFSFTIVSIALVVWV